MKYDSIIFDLDGTLWNAVDNILISWNMALKKHPEIDKSISKAELELCMGLKMDEIAERLFPLDSYEKRMELMWECSKTELEFLAENGGCIFEGAKEAIAALSEKYRLFICSNCQKGYIECFLKYYSLEKYFTDFECWGRTGLSKGENNRLLIKRNRLLSPVYIGDTKGDRQSALEANIPFFYASYGFGDVREYDEILFSPTDLLKLL